MSLNVEVATEIQKLEPSSVIELYELDCTDLGGDVFRFHNGTNKLSQNIIWQGLEYIRFPIQVTGFETTGQGQFPRPTVLVSNVMSAITTVLLQYGDLLSSKFIRKRTFTKYLDAINFPGAVNPTADPDVFFQDEIFYIDRKTYEDRDQIHFELSSATDLQGVQLPQRVVIQSVCPWIYRGPDCGYTGVAIYDDNDYLLPPPTSPEAIAMRNAWQEVKDDQAALASAQAALAAASDAMVAASIYTENEAYHVPPLYIVDLPAFYVATNNWNTYVEAYWNNVQVTLGTTYTRGEYKEQKFAGFGDKYYYSIIEHTRDETAYAASVTAYNNAVIARDDAQDDLDVALSDFDTAMAAVPPDDPVFKQDRCGKRITSCKLRFGSITPNSPLPFGGFPGVSR